MSTLRVCWGAEGMADSMGGLLAGAGTVALKGRDTSPYSECQGPETDGPGLDLLLCVLGQVPSPPQLLSRSVEKG